MRSSIVVSRVQQDDVGGVLLIDFVNHLEQGSGIATTVARVGRCFVLIWPNKTDVETTFCEHRYERLTIDCERLSTRCDGVTEWQNGGLGKEGNTG